MGWIDKRIGLALGGGGARGFAHIGVIRVLQENKIPIDIIVGTSSGALIGGAYASGTTPDEMERKINAYLNSEEYLSSAIRTIEKAHDGGHVSLTKKIQGFLQNKFLLLQAMFKPGILSAEEFQSMIDFFIPDIPIQDTPIPFRAVATDLISGEQVVFSEGSLREAIMTSSAVPGAIEPRKMGDMLLSDGGIISLVPVNAARKEGADIVIAVNITRGIFSEDELETAQEISDRASDISSYHLTNYELARADIVIRPNVGNLHWSVFSHAGTLIAEGEKAARSSIPDIRMSIPLLRKWFAKDKKQNIAN
ncbi:MAG TPA: patatin-like phospholipase family protein [Syntrophales bacterium]|nr:patatin-like phospholipase family protein [Syntrophales bacterium]HPQ43098.1 patatin-like phospholipase family protein [Syntrophales bacterium]